MNYIKSSQLIFLALVIVLSSCASVHQTTDTPGMSFIPDITRFEMGFADLEYLGEVEISYQSRRYLGLFRHLDSVNDEIVSVRHTERVSFSGKMGFKMNNYLEMAAVKAVENYPEADFFVPVYKITTVEKMFMGRIYREKMLLKAYRFKQ